MFSLEIDRGNGGKESANSYFAYIEERMNRDAERLVVQNAAQSSRGVVVEHVEADTIFVQQSECIKAA